MAQITGLEHWPHRRCMGPVHNTQHRALSQPRRLVAALARHGVEAQQQQQRPGGDEQQAADVAPAALPEVVVGIDLGTTNSAVAWMEGRNRPRCIPNWREGEKVTPSVVAFLPDGDVVVGKAARKLQASQPDNTFYSVKRIIGRAASDPIVKEEAPRLAYQVSQDEEGQVVLQCSHVPRGYIYPEEVSAHVLAQLLDDAEIYTGGQVRKAVISVPAYFNSKQRDATAAAGKLAGLETVRIIHEPVAAALAYGINLKEDQTVLVFDLGGGTYDISLLEVGNGTIEVLSTGGDAHLGGDDWDALVVDWLVRTHLSKGPTPLDPASDPHLRANLRALAEAAKQSLTENEEVQLRMPVGGHDGGPLEVRLTRAQLQKLAEPLWRRARLPLDQACWAAGVDLNALVVEVDDKRDELSRRGVPSWKTETMRPEIRPKARAPLTRVLLVGGASRMPAISSFIRNMTGLEPELDVINPDEAVALGAAVQAGILQGQVKDLMVMDQWQASLMRAMAQLQLKRDAPTRTKMAERFSDVPSLSDDLTGQAASPSAAAKTRGLKRPEPAGGPGAALPPRDPLAGDTFVLENQEADELAQLEERRIITELDEADQRQVAAAAPHASLADAGKGRTTTLRQPRRLVRQARAPAAHRQRARPGLVDATEGGR